MVITISVTHSHTVSFSATKTREGQQTQTIRQETGESGQGGVLCIAAGGVRPTQATTSRSTANGLISQRRHVERENRFRSHGACAQLTQNTPPHRPVCRSASNFGTLDRGRRARETASAVRTAHPHRPSAKRTRWTRPILASTAVHTVV